MAERTIILDLDTIGIYVWINKSDPWHTSMCALPEQDG
jgi:hypothetical protein